MNSQPVTPAATQGSPLTPTPNRRLKILFTEGTSLSARQSLYALGDRHDVDVMDPAPLCQCRFSRLVRRWIRCPHYAKDPEAFLEFLAQRVTKGDYDVLLPTHEQVYLLSKYHAALTPHIGLALPDFRPMDQMQNKAEFMRLLDELDLPHPATVHVRTRRELIAASVFPCYVKLGHSTAGSGVFRVENASQLSTVAETMDAAGLLDGHCETIVQQPAVGVQSTVQAVFQHGRLVAAHLFEARTLGVGGMSPARVSADHPVVFEHVAAIGRRLNWHGATFIDYFYDHETGRPEYIEANPRIGETVNATLCGVNLVETLLAVSVGDELPTLAPSTCSALAASSAGRRTQSFFMIAISLAHAGAGRMRLLAETRDWFLGRGLYHNSEDELTRWRDDGLSVLPVAWILAQLLWTPWRSSHRLVQNTIDNYSLPEAAVRRLIELPDSALSKWLPSAD